MASYFRSIGNFIWDKSVGVYNWGWDKVKAIGSGVTEWGVNFVLDNVPYLKKGSKFTLKSEGDSFMTLNNLELALDRTNEKIASFNLPFEVTEASLGEIVIEKNEKRYAIIVSDLNLSVKLGSKAQSPPPQPQAIKQDQPPQDQEDSDKITDCPGNDYAGLAKEYGNANESTPEKETKEAILKILRTLEITLEKIKITIEDPSATYSMELCLNKVNFNGTSTQNKSERVSKLSIENISLKSGESEVFNFRPGKDDSINITQAISSGTDSEENLFGEILSLKRLKKVDINFSESKIGASIGIDQVNKMTELILAFINTLIESNEQEIDSNRKSKNGYASNWNEIQSESLYGISESNLNLHNTVFGKKIDLFKEINLESISGNSDFSIVLGEISFKILAAQNFGCEKAESLCLGLKRVEFKMDSTTGIINASLESITGDIVKEEGDHLSVFRFKKSSMESKDINVYLGTDTNLDFLNKAGTEVKRLKQTKGYLIKVNTASQLDINFDPKILEILFVNKLLDLTPLAKKAEMPPATIPKKSDEEVQKEPVRNSGLKMFIAMDCNLQIHIGIPMNAVIPYKDAERRKSTEGYMFIHNLIKDYLDEESCAFDIEASSLSFFSASTEGTFKSSVMGIGFERLKVDLLRKDSSRTVFESRGKKEKMVQPYPILISSISGNGKLVAETDMLNSKTSFAFEYLEPDLVYANYTRNTSQTRKSEGINPEKFVKDRGGINIQKSTYISGYNPEMKEGYDEEKEEIDKINSTHTFNKIFKDPYLIYGNIPKDEASTSNWDYYSSKCVFKCFVELEYFALDVQPDEIALFFKVLDLTSNPNADMSQSYVDLEDARLKVYDCEKPHAYSILDFPGTKYMQITNFNGNPGTAIKVYASSKWFNLYEYNYVKEGSKNLIFQFVVNEKSLTNKEKKLMQIDYSKKNRESYPSYLITGELYFDNDGTFAYVKPLRIAPVVSVFLAISDYLDPPKLRCLERYRKKEEQDEKDKEEEERIPESVMKVMLKNAFFVTKKGEKAVLFLSVLGGFLLEMKTGRDGSRLISIKLGNEISCAVKGEQRLCLFPESLVLGSYEANLKGCKFAQLTNKNGPQYPVFIMDGSLIECKSFNININMSTEIEKCLLSDLESFGSIIDDLMLQSSEEKQDPEEKEEEINLYSKMEDRYIAKSFRKVDKVKAIKSLFFIPDEDDDSLSMKDKAKRGVEEENDFRSKMEENYIAKVFEGIAKKEEITTEERDDILKVKEDSRSEFEENGITEIEVSKDGPMVIKVNDCVVSIKIAPTEKVSVSNDIVIRLDISEIVYSSWKDLTNENNNTYIKFLAKDFNINKGEMDILKFDERRKTKWQERYNGGLKDPLQSPPIFGIFSDNRIAFYYREVDNHLNLNFSVQPVDISLRWNEVKTVNDYYDIYKKQENIWAERQKYKKEFGRIVDGKNDFKVVYTSGARVKIDSLHIWPIGVKVSIGSKNIYGGTSSFNNEEGYIPLIPSSLWATLEVIGIGRLPWHLNPIMVKRDSKYTFYKDDISAIVMSQYRSDYSLGKLLRAAMHVGPMKSILKLGKALVSIVNVEKCDIKSFRENFSNLGVTILEICADGTNCIYLVTKTVDESLSGVPKDLASPEEEPNGFIDGVTKLSLGLFCGIKRGIEAITLDPFRIYQDHGIIQAFKAFIFGVPCTVIRPVGEAMRGVTIFFYGAKKSLTSSETKK